MSTTKTIDGRAKTVRELLSGARYTIDFYQREYAWQQRQVHELIDDLTAKFLDSHDDGDERHEVATYGHYFLGSVVICHKREQKFIVDGQQRLTTLTLLLIHLNHLQKGRPDGVPVDTLIFSTKFGERKFNLDVEQRSACMERLFKDGAAESEDAVESVQNIVARYQDIREHFPEELVGKALPFFIDWLLENVHLVEIDAYSDDDAYTIFETMNDRGLSLSLPEMLKGYMLANILKEDAQRHINELWKSRMQELKDVDKEADVDFFKNWLRARHAQTIRQGKGAENKDYASGSDQSSTVGSGIRRWSWDSAGTDSFVTLFVEAKISTSTPNRHSAFARPVTRSPQVWSRFTSMSTEASPLRLKCFSLPSTPKRARPTSIENCSSWRITSTFGSLDKRGMLQTDRAKLRQVQALHAH